MCALCILMVLIKKSPLRRFEIIPLLGKKGILLRYVESFFDNIFKFGVSSMFFKFGIKNKTVKELRKNQGYTTRELAARIKVDNIDILKIDNLKLKEVKEPLYSKILPILNGDDVDKIPWL